MLMKVMEGSPPTTKTHMDFALGATTFRKPMRGPQTVFPGFPGWPSESYLRLSDKYM